MQKSKIILFLSLLIIVGGCYIFRSEEENISLEWKGKKVEDLYLAWGKPDKEIPSETDKLLIYERKELERTPEYWTKSPSKEIYRDGRQTTRGVETELYRADKPSEDLNIYSFWVGNNGIIYKVEVKSSKKK